MRKIAVRIQGGWAYGIKNKSNSQCDIHETTLSSGPQTYCNTVHTNEEVDAADRYPLKEWEQKEEDKRVSANRPA